MRDSSAEELAELLGVCRERAKLSQQELAKLLFIDQAIISKVENGKLTPSYALVKEWAAATNGAELLGMDFVGNSGWKRLKSYEEQIDRIKGILQVQFLRIKATGRRRQS